MTRYKLIKKYPDSPEIGTIIEKEDRYYYIDKNTHLRYSNVEKYPEFWEEIVEKDYEIITFGFKGGVDRTLDNQGKYSLVNSGSYLEMKGIDGKTLIDLTKTTNYYIKSVRRLSDGEIFTVGDKVDSTISDLGRFTDLTGFKLDNNKILFGLRDLGYYPLSTIIKYKKPLFTTEDGVDIYEGDKISSVSLSTMELFTTDGLVGSNTSPAKGFKYFSTKEAAENYIYNNKKRFSINDVIDAIPLYIYGMTIEQTKSQILGNLKNLAQDTTE